MSLRLSSDKIQQKKYIALNVYIIKQIMLMFTLVEMVTDMFHLS